MISDIPAKCVLIVRQGVDRIVMHRRLFVVGTIQVDAVCRYLLAAVCPGVALRQCSRSCRMYLAAAAIWVEGQVAMESAK
jgi:hypothetical protein